MPINYYCSIGMVGSNIEMNKNQLLEPVIENSASQPSSPVEGQMYYDTTVGDKKMYFYNGSAWVEMDGSGSGVISLTPTDGTFIDITQNATSGAITTTADLSATGTPSATKFLIMYGQLQQEHILNGNTKQMVELLLIWLTVKF